MVKVISLAVILGVCGSSAVASPLSVTNTFESGTPAVAAEVNQNFNDVETAVNDNDVRISTNTANIGINSTSITTNATNIQGNSDAIAALTPTASALKVYDNGVRLGAYVGGGSGVRVLTDKGYSYYLGAGTEKTAPVNAFSNLLYHTTPDCTGAAYFMDSVNAIYLKPSVGGLIAHNGTSTLYVPIGATTATMGIASVSQVFNEQLVLCNQFNPVSNIDVYELIPNDPVVTGVPNSFTGEISIGY